MQHAHNALLTYLLHVLTPYFMYVGCMYDVRTYVRVKLKKAGRGPERVRRLTRAPALALHNGGELIYLGFFYFLLFLPGGGGGVASTVLRRVGEWVSG